MTIPLAFATDQRSSSNPMSLLATLPHSLLSPNLLPFFVPEIFLIAPIFSFWPLSTFSVHSHPIAFSADGDTIPLPSKNRRFRHTESLVSHSVVRKQCIWTWSYPQQFKFHGNSNPLEKI